jgi:hypothetical protein
MTEYLKESAKERRDSGVGDRRRRSSDNPQPLDYVTRELVKDIVDSKPRAESPRKTFIQKLLNVD